MQGPRQPEETDDSDHQEHDPEEAAIWNDPMTAFRNTPAMSVGARHRN